MSTNPFYNALCALAYIVMLVSIVFVSPGIFGGPDESIFYPMIALSTLVLSVALMAFLFFYQPITLLLDGKREQAVKLFLQTIGIFAVGIFLLLIGAVVIRG